MLHGVEGFAPGAPGHSSTCAVVEVDKLFFLALAGVDGGSKGAQKEHRSGSPLFAGCPAFSWGSWNCWCNIKQGQGAIQVPLLCLFSIFPFFFIWLKYENYLRNKKKSR